MYTDFGEDMTALLAADGISLKIESPCSPEAPAPVTERMLSFYWQKRLPVIRKLYRQLTSPSSAFTTHWHRRG